MKARNDEVCIPAMHAAFRRVVGSDSPAVAILACENNPKIRRAVEAVYAEIMREREAASKIDADKAEV